jgi:hypothetical protein
VELKDNDRVEVVFAIGGGAHTIFGEVAHGSHR